MRHEGRHKVATVLSAPLAVKLLSGGHARRVEAAPVRRNVCARNSRAQFLIRGVRSLGESKLATTSRQTWVVHALGKLRVPRIGAIRGILGSAILRTSRQLAARCL